MACVVLLDSFREINHEGVAGGERKEGRAVRGVLVDNAL